MSHAPQTNTQNASTIITPRYTDNAQITAALDEFFMSNARGELYIAERMNINETMIIPINESPRKKTENIMPAMTEYVMRRASEDEKLMLQICLRMMNAMIALIAMMINQMPNAQPPEMSARISKP